MALWLCNSGQAVLRNHSHGQPNADGTELVLRRDGGCTEGLEPSSRHGDETVVRLPNELERPAASRNG